MDDQVYPLNYFNNWDQVLPLIQIRIDRLRNKAVQERKKELTQQWNVLAKEEQDLRLPLYYIRTDRRLVRARYSPGEENDQWLHFELDNGLEFTAKAVRRWLNDLGVNALFIEPGSLWENGYIESFNGKLRDELLDREIFTTLTEAKILIEEWRTEYNQTRPHSALDYRAPAPETIAVDSNLTSGTINGGRSKLSTKNRNEQGQRWRRDVMLLIWTTSFPTIYPGKIIATILRY